MRNLLVAVLLLTASFAEAGTAHLNVLIYNIKELPLPPGSDKGRAKKIGRRLAELRARGEGFDVVLLQEAMNRKGRRINRYAGFPHRVEGPRPKLPEASAGLLVLSEHPLSARREHVFRQAISWDMLSRKGVVLAELAVPGVPEPIAILNTHMQAGPTQDPFTPVERCDEVRAAQILELRSFLLENLLPGTPILFGGDFNFRPSDVTGQYQEFAGATGFRNAAEDCEADEACEYPEGIRPWQRVVDHIFYTDAPSRMRITPELFRTRFDGRLDPVLSDHSGREVRLRLDW